ncbi:IclR family transcriptional regulator [Psychrobacter sp. AOP22-C1-22]|uniref:IclR family transcriptional regulator n=1 Tax=unclassified Psychrobacter TaxID=196806 RepID=UPI0017889E96|nr:MULTISPECIES: IclR family transcriptional regulator C-terminal domain-containing protein [unclassified Psychrobacter]MBE0406052.1 helix-turn-helix domain-containing protein [Psychrobacter sp. FME6]MBE0444571.1 helix-turn-helix domain-containing protein [Psychrobacter sp. FME5]MDN5802439.1 helix-turn-helix domain-containing protein [Psychrobacter sp.]MDN5891502.1 helix-turn-helix domain-containing protein [Psychrobacter sp.]
MTKNISAALPLLTRMNTILEQSKENNDRQFVTALGRGLTLLSAFEHHDQLSHQQLCQMTTLPKATITRLIHTLMTLGFLRITEYGQYQLGSSAVRLSATAWSRHDMVAAAEPLLRQFASSNEVSVNLATEVEGEMRYHACCRSPARLSVNLQVGSAVPVARTAIGRAFYAASSPARQAIIDSNLKEHLSTEDYNHAQSALSKAAEHYKAYGYTVSDGEFSTDILAVAVGVFDVATGQYAYSLNASVPRANWDADNYALTMVAKLQVLADKIGRSA